MNVLFRCTRPCLLTLLVILSAPLLALAADEPTTRLAPRERPRAGMMLDRARHLLDDIKLTDEQQKKIDAIFQKAKEDAETMRDANKDLAPAERGEKFRAFMKDLHDKIGAELTDEQKKTFEENLAAARERMRAMAAPGATTRPGDTTQPAGPGERIARRLEQLKESVAKLDLTDEQKAKIQKLMSDTREKIQKMRDEARDAAERGGDKIRELMEDMRTQMQSILTPEQQQKLREMMRPPGEDGAGPRRQPARRNAPDNADQKPKGPNAKADDGPDDLAAGPPIVGQQAPDLALVKLDGLPVRLSSFKGHILVIEFGSYSTPSFRQRAAEMEKLKRDYNRKAEFLIVYTKEAHPTGGWEVDRNKDEGISVPQPDNDTARRALAKKAKDALKITIPIAIDTMDNTVADAYALLPNGAAVISRNGTVFAAQSWTDPSGLARLIDQAATPTTKPAG